MGRMIDADAIPYNYINERGVPMTREIDIQNMPTIEERKTGKWIQDQKSKRYRCDQCFSFALRTDDRMENLSDFCSVCGAMMKGKQS